MEILPYDISKKKDGFYFRLLLGTKFMQLVVTLLYLVIDMQHLLVALRLDPIKILFCDLALLELGFGLVYLGPIFTPDRVEFLDPVLNFFHL